MKWRWLVAFAAAWAALIRLGRTSGSTAEERNKRLPGDEVVLYPNLGGDHAISIEAPPLRVWPWLVQMGWHRAGWYTYRWVDALMFPNNWPSAETILQEYQDLKVGDVVPDGPMESGCFFVVEQMQAEHHLVLHSTTHLPPQLLKNPDVSLSWTWVFVIEPENGGTRFHFRWRVAVSPLWLRLLGGLLILPADFLMGRSMCKGLKRRAEAFGS
ncbi:MAG TPA: SRPBCC family protein [Dehalococcoidia bacterium]|nr:SRPBCC family protein [Dehalococcoidia bacterium]